MESLRRNIVYRRERRLGRPRHWWRSHTFQSAAVAAFIGIWSLAELGLAALGPGWTQAQAQRASAAFLFVFLVLGPLRAGLSLRRDVQTKVAESLLAAGVPAKEYLRGKLFAALRPTFLLLPALWLRHLLEQIRYDPALGQWAGLGEGSLVALRLATDSVGFFVTALLWLLGVLFYGALAVALTLRWRGAFPAMLAVAAVAFAVDIWWPQAIEWIFPRMRPPLSDYLFAVGIGLGVASLFLKWVLYLWLLDESAARFDKWALE